MIQLVLKDKNGKTTTYQKTFPSALDMRMIIDTSLKLAKVENGLEEIDLMISCLVAIFSEKELTAETILAGLPGNQEEFFAIYNKICVDVMGGEEKKENQTKTTV